MSRYKHRRMFLVPAARRDVVNAELLRNGYGPDNLSVPLARTTNGPVTHYLCDIACDDSALVAFNQPQVTEENPGRLGSVGRLNAVLDKHGLTRKPAGKLHGQKTSAGVFVAGSRR